MNNAKKVLIVFLSMAMLLCTVPIGVFADASEYNNTVSGADEVEIFKDYLKNTLIPGYGSFDAVQTGTVNSTTENWFSPEGILSASIFDYDLDNSKELLVIYTQEYNFGYTINMGVYEIENNQVTLADNSIFSAFNPNTTYPCIDLCENEGHQKNINMSIVEVDDRIFIVCESSVKSGLYEGTAPDYWILNYNGEKIQYTASFTKTAGGSSDFEYTAYTFDNGTLKDAELIQSLNDDFDAELIDFFGNYNIKLDLDSSHNSILSDENTITPIFNFGVKLIYEDWNSYSFTFESTLSAGPYEYALSESQQDTAIAVFTTEKSLSVQTNKSMWLAFGLIEKGELIGNWEKMSIAISDPTIIELSEYEETEYGYSVEVIGKKQGTTNITITDTKSGANTSCIINVYDNYTKSYTYNINGIAAASDGLSTNIYDLNGLYVSNYNCISKGSYYYVSMDVYNSKYHTGAVDVYDANDTWIKSYPIEKYSDISSLWDTGEQAVYLISDLANNKLLTYQQASFAKHTPITNIEVPEGGYIVISNNFSESAGTFFYNASEILFEATVTWFETVISLNINEELDKSEFIETLMGQILEDPSKRDAWIDIFNTTLQKETEDFATKLLTEEASDAYSNFADDFEDILNSMGIKWKHIFQSATGVGESAFAKFSGTAGFALKACFAFTGYTNKMLRAIHIAQSIDEPYATAFSSVDEGYINPHGVVVNTNGNIDSEAVLQVFKVSGSDTLDVILDSDNPLEKYELYNISFVKNDKNVQPNGNVKVYIPIPKDMIGNTGKIYRQENDGSWTMLDAHIEDNYFVFETEHFSLYAIIGNTAELIIKEPPSKLQYIVGDTLNSEGLILELNEQLITTGYICRPTVLSQCGDQEITVVYGSSTAVFNVHVTCSEGEHHPQSDYMKNETHHWQICSICQSELEKTEHGFENWSKIDDATHGCICECGEFETENHTFGDLIVTKEATEYENGTKEKSCVCGYSVTEEIPKKSCCNQSPKAIIIIVGALAAGVILLVIIYVIIKKKKL